jgi:hypothetical protein
MYIYKSKITIKKTLLINPHDLAIVKDARKNGYTVRFSNSVSDKDVIIFDGKLDFREDRGKIYANEPELSKMQSRGYGFIEYKDNIYRYIIIKA